MTIAADQPTNRASSTTGVVLGYVPDAADGAALKLGSGARLRTGTIVYSGSFIGQRFRTGHHVVIREGSVIGDDVSIWSNSIIDYGCVIGDRVKIHANCYVAQFTEIDDDAFLAPGVASRTTCFPGAVPPPRRCRVRPSAPVPSWA